MLTVNPKSKDMVIPCQATKGKGLVEGVTTRELSPNNNTLHERPLSF